MYRFANWGRRYIIYIYMKDYRRLTEDEVLQLKSQSCLADDWGNVLVAEGFNSEYVHHTRFSGEVKLGVFDAEFTLPGGIKNTRVYGMLLCIM